jgi:hypothetical protein
MSRRRTFPSASANLPRPSDPLSTWVIVSQLQLNRPDRWTPLNQTRPNTRWAGRISLVAIKGCRKGGGRRAEHPGDCESAELRHSRDVGKGHAR